MHRPLELIVFRRIIPQQGPIIGIQDLGANSQGSESDLMAIGSCITFGHGKLRFDLGTSVPYCILPVRSWDPLGQMEIESSVRYRLQYPGT